MTKTRKAWMVLTPKGKPLIASISDIRAKWRASQRDGYRIVRVTLSWEDGK